MSPTVKPLAGLAALKLTLPPRLARWAHLFLACELAYGVPAALMAAICDRESLGGDALQPPGPGGLGDGGHGHGLGQLDGRFHGSFLAARFGDGDACLWADPAFNLMYGAKLLSQGFGKTHDWNVAIAAYNCGLARATRAVAALAAVGEELRIASLDKQTTGGDYVTDVRRRCASFADETQGVG